MKLRNVSVLLFASACGGGGKDNPIPVDSLPGDGNGGFFPNSRNDVFLVTFPMETGFTPVLTPDVGDFPDNEVALSVGQAGGKKVSGEMGIAGDHSDDYFERDTYLIATAANVNQLTVRMAWDGGTADMDYALFEEPAAGSTDLVLFSTGTLISDTLNEFQTFTVDPSKNYLLWGGVFNANAGGGAPSLPAPYDFSLYGANVAPASVGACNVTEAADATNNSIEAFGGVGTRENNGVSIATSHVFCGALNTGRFLADAVDTTRGTDDVDAFSFNLPIDGDLLVTLVGATDADNTAIQALLATGALAVALFNDANPDTDPATAGAQPRPQQFFGNSEVDFLGSHGVTAFTMINSATTDTVLTTDVVGPKTLAIFLQSNAPGILTANINYKIQVTVDNRNTRAGRIAAAADTTEANDN